MTAHEFPTFYAEWRPLLLRPTPGSAEALTVGMLVRVHGGQAQVRQVMAPQTLRDVFGAAGPGMLAVVVRTLSELQRQLDDATPVERLEMPFGGFELGRSDEVAARDLNEAFDIVSRMGTAFGTSRFGAPTPRAPNESQRAFEDWARQVRDQASLVAANVPLLEGFDQKMRVSARRIVRFGYMHERFAAQFGVLRTGRRGSADLRGVKVKIFDLQSLAQWQPIAQRRAAIFIGTVDLASAGLAVHDRESLAESWRFVDQEARARGVEAVRCPTPQAAVEALVERLRA